MPKKPTKRQVLKAISDHHHDNPILAALEAKDHQVRDGQIWEDLTPGYQRFVKIAHTGSKQALIYRVEKDANGLWQRAKRAPSRFTDLTRFNGKSGGFRRVEIATHDSE